MKSSYELALERVGGEAPKKLSDEQKAAIAEVDAKYKAKIAEVNLTSRPQIEAADDVDAASEARQAMANRIVELEDKAEREKDKIRQGETS